MRWPSKDPDDFLAESESDWKRVRSVPPPVAVDAAVGALLVAGAIIVGATNASIGPFLGAFVGLVAIRTGISLWLARRMEPLEWIPPPRWMAPTITVAVLLVGDILSDRAQLVWLAIVMIPIGIWDHRAWTSGSRRIRKA